MLDTNRETYHVIVDTRRYHLFGTKLTMKIKGPRLTFYSFQKAIAFAFSRAQQLFFLAVHETLALAVALSPARHMLPV